MNYKMLATEYFNAGGHCMVTICDVYFPEDHQLMFVYVCDGYATLFSRDYLRGDDEPDDYYEITIDSWLYLDEEICSSEQYKDLLEEAVRIHQQNIDNEFDMQAATASDKKTEINNWIDKVFEKRSDDSYCGDYTVKLMAECYDLTLALEDAECVEDDDQIIIKLTVLNN